VTDLNERNRFVIEEFRQNGGKVGGQFGRVELKPLPLLLLTTTGAKTGQHRIIPLGYMADGDRFIIVAAKGGAPAHPDWYHNLVAYPEVTVEVGTETFKAISTVITDDEERDRLLTSFIEIAPQITGYLTKTTRKFPVIALERKE
jgi:deazaflavin-dependent oxidoreductase (nitroreductase family)